MTKPHLIPATVKEWIKTYTDDFGFVPKTPEQPITAPKGTWERVEALAQRVRKGEPIWGPADEDLYEFTRREVQSMKPPVWVGNEMAGAEFSEDRQYRYRLWRHWAKDLPVVAFVGLNPSTADEKKLDRTMSRLKSFAQAWGCGGMEMLNLFAYRSTDPKILYDIDDPIGRYNDRAIRLVVKACSYTVCCWGNHGTISSRSAQVLWAISKTIPKKNVYCFRLTKPKPGGIRKDVMYPQPEHPLYMPSETKLIRLPWSQMEVGKTQ